MPASTGGDRDKVYNSDTMVLSRNSKSEYTLDSFKKRTRLENNLFFYGSADSALSL